MSLYSAAQTLPLHIAKKIVSYVVWNKGVISDMDKVQITDHNKMDLLILMKVCHHWRSAVLPFHYRSAFLTLNKAGIRRFNKHVGDLLNLDEVIVNKSQHYIQKLYIELWSSALVQPEAAMEDLRYIVKQCGQLKRARTMVLKFNHDLFCQPYISSDLDITLVNDLKRTLAEYARLLNELLPNMYQLVLQSTDYYIDNDNNWQTTYLQVPQNLHFFLRENITSLLLKMFPASEKLVDGLEKARLQHLSIDRSKDISLYIDLIRQNSASLEFLKLGHFLSNLSILFLPPGDSGVLTYPRLKKIDISGYKRDDIAVYEQLESDPFPALEQFTYNDYISHSTLAILQMGKSHIRKLNFGIAGEAMDAVESNNIFTASSYSALDSMCIWFIISFPSFDSEKASRLIAMLLSLSPTTRHVRLRNTNFPNASLFNFDDAVFPDIIQSDALQTLNLCGMEFTMDQIVKLASKFKNLDTFSVVLKDYPNGGPKAPDNNEVQQWKAKLKAYTSNVRTICIKRTRFPNSRRCVEFVVLMASILEGVGRVTFKTYRRRDNLYSPLKKIRSVLKRSVYTTCEYVHKVEFYIDKSPC